MRAVYFGDLDPYTARAAPDGLPDARSTLPDGCSEKVDAGVEMTQTRDDLSPIVVLLSST